MRQHWIAATLAVSVAALLPGVTIVERSVAAQSSRAASVTAVPGAIGFLDPTGPYEVVPGWPKDLSTLPGNERWTFGAGQGVFAESPDRVYLLGGGELPNIPRPQTTQLSEIGTNVLFPIAGLPWRNANTATPPGAGGTGQDPSKGMELWRGSSPPYL